MCNFVEPEGYDKGSVSEEVPEIVSSYTAPTELGDDLLAPQLEFWWRSLFPSGSGVCIP